jgi:drug/metabolite transporter (DMT)-like permease
MKLQAGGGVGRWTVDDVVAVWAGGQRRGLGWSAVAGKPHELAGTPVLAMLALAVVCTALAFVLFFALIAEIGGVRATVITFVNPAMAVILGPAVLGEDITLLTGVAFRAHPGRLGAGHRHRVEAPVHG